MMSRRFLSRIVCSSLILCTSIASAGDIAAGGTITQIKNVTGNMTQWAIWITGGTGVCLGNWIVFPLSAAPDADTHKRGYATALMATALGMRVKIHNYSGDDCLNASYIEAYF